jgi:hypothetical protein
MVGVEEEDSEEEQDEQDEQPKQRKTRLAETHDLQGVAILARPNSKHNATATKPSSSPISSPNKPASLPTALGVSGIRTRRGAAGAKDGVRKRHGGMTLEMRLFCMLLVSWTRRGEGQSEGGEREREGREGKERGREKIGGGGGRDTIPVHGSHFCLT